MKRVVLGVLALSVSSALMAATPKFDGARISADVKELVEKRTAAKKAKDFARADALRAKITELGWNVMDTAKGPQLTKL